MKDYQKDFNNKFIYFFEQLKENNTREWFHEHKTYFEERIRAPFVLLVEEVIKGIHKKYDPEININAQDAVFRIYRDMRFSKDKTPYKPFVSAVISTSGRKNIRVPGIYISLGADGAFLAGGCYHLSPDNLRKVRRKLVEDSEILESILHQRTVKQLFGKLRGEKNKILPPEFKPYAESIPHLYHKTLFLGANYSLEEFFAQKNLSKYILRHYAALHPLNVFFKGIIKKF